MTREDAWQRAVELLFERLAVRWVIAGAPIERQRELLLRFRAASAEERAWIRTVLREHCAEHFPEIEPPEEQPDDYLLAFTAGAFAVLRVPFRIASLWPAATGRPSSASSAGSTWAAKAPAAARPPWRREGVADQRVSRRA